MSFDEEELKSPHRMLELYAKGAFPMADESDQIHWYLPDVRAVITMDDFNIPRSLKKFLKECDFEFTFDQDPFAIIKGCANRKKTWINEKLVKGYEGLHKIGAIHSVEVWQNFNLVGGLYGITYGGAFFGESMFSKVPQASKTALAKLIERLLEKKFVFIDIQFLTEHLKMFGAKEIKFKDYYTLLLKSYSRNCSFN